MGHLAVGFLEKRVLLINAEPISLFDNIDKILDSGLFLHIFVHHVLQSHVVIIYAHARDYRAEDSVCPTLMDSKGKSKRKRPPYDPELALAVSKRRKQHSDLKAELEKTVPKITDIASSLLTSDDVLQCSFSSDAIEVVLIATVGLEGLINLRHAMSMVPQNVPDRSTRIVSLVTEQVQVSPDRIKRCIELIEKLHVVEGHYQRFLSPPVSCCINEKCHMQGKFGSLVACKAP